MQIKKAERLIMSKNKKRIIYFIMTVLIVFTEVMIALFVHDAFVRPYLGDVLAVAAVYSFVRIFIPEKVRLLPLYVFLFAATVEVLQMFDYVSLLGLGESRFFRILLGSVFDIKDVLCYAVGCILLGVFEIIRMLKNKNEKD